MIGSSGSEFWIFVSWAASDPFTSVILFSQSALPVEMTIYPTMTVGNVPVFFFKKKKRKRKPTYLAIIWMHRTKHLCLPVDLKLIWICVMTYETKVQSIDFIR